MQYLLLMASASDAESVDAADDSTRAWIDDVDSHGANVHGGRLRPVDDATTVRVRGGDVLVTDGPFAETREHIVGYNVIDAPSIEDAIEIAGAHPAARSGQIEVRPVWPLEFT